MPSAQQASANRSVELEANFVAVGRRFACCVNSSARDDLQSIKWITGTVRAATETDSNNEEQQFCVEWDGKDPLREYEWIYLHETPEEDRFENVNGGNYSCFLIEDKLMWLETQDSSGSSSGHSASKGSKAPANSPKQFRPASTYLALVDHIDYHARNRVPVHLLAESCLDFVDKDQLYVFPVQDRQTSLNIKGTSVPVLKDHQIAINHWFEARRNQQRLIFDKDKQLIGQSVQVYWKDGASQRWYAACLKSYNNKDQTVTVMDYNVIQDRKVDPRLEEIRIVRDTGRSALTTTSSSPTPGIEMNSRARRPSRQISKSEVSEKSTTSTKKRKATTSPKRSAKKPGRKTATTSPTVKSKNKRLAKAEPGQKRPRGRPPSAKNKKSTPVKRGKAAGKSSSAKKLGYSSDDDDDMSVSEDEDDDTQESDDDVEKDNDEEDEESIQEENGAQSNKNKRATESPSVESDDDDEPSWSLSKLSNKRIKSITRGRASGKSSAAAAPPVVIMVSEPAPPASPPVKTKGRPKKKPAEKPEVKQEDRSSASDDDEKIPAKKNGKTNGRAPSAKTKAAGKPAKRAKSSSESPSRNTPSRGKKQPLSYKEESEDESLTEPEGSEPPKPAANAEPVPVPAAPPVAKKEEKAAPPFNPLNIRKVRPRKPAEKKKTTFPASSNDVTATLPANDTTDKRSPGMPAQVSDREGTSANSNEHEARSPTLVKPQMPPASPPSPHAHPNRSYESPAKRVARVAAQPQEQTTRDAPDTQPAPVPHRRGPSSHSEPTLPNQAQPPSQQQPTFPPTPSHQPHRQHNASSSHNVHPSASPMYDTRPHTSEASFLPQHADSAVAGRTVSSADHQRSSAQAYHQQAAAFSMTPSPFRATTPSPFVPRNAPVSNPQQQQQFGQQSTSQPTAYRQQPSANTYTSQGQQQNAAAAYFSPYANPAFFYPGHIGSPAGFASTTPVMYGSAMYANAMGLPAQATPEQWNMMMIQNPMMAGMAMQQQQQQQQQQMTAAAGGNNRGAATMRSSVTSPDARPGAAGGGNPLTGVISGAMQALNNFSIPSPPLGVAAYSPYLMAAGAKQASSGLHGQPSNTPSPHTIHSKESPKEGPRASSTHSTHSSSSGGRRTNRTPDLGLQGLQGTFQARASPQHFMPSQPPIPPVPHVPEGSKGRGQSSSAAAPKAETPKRGRQAQPKEKAVPAETANVPVKESPKRKSRKKATPAVELPVSDVVNQLHMQPQMQMPVPPMPPVKESSLPSATLGEPCPLTMLSTIATFHDPRGLTTQAIKSAVSGSVNRLNTPPTEAVHPEAPKPPLVERPETVIMPRSIPPPMVAPSPTEETPKPVRSDEEPETKTDSVQHVTEAATGNKTPDTTVVDSDNATTIPKVTVDPSTESYVKNDVNSPLAVEVGQVTEVVITEESSSTTMSSQTETDGPREELPASGPIVSEPEGEAGKQSSEEAVTEFVGEPVVEPAEVTVGVENPKEDFATKPTNGSHVPLVSYASSDEEEDNPRLRIVDESQENRVSPQPASAIVLSEIPMPGAEPPVTEANSTEGTAAPNAEASTS
ncbi:hypothetical protein RvY_05142 [Ramazzottius varieornatus]|uniref:Uncharacterized protein n=1 Tax=Ramazzottius varieornatus TaxID=947166 RepID=A0A1D1UU39_RAMVA|nr:hypothetical protein RvY_05142 [Ramazzottius varieornatus]